MESFRNQNYDELKKFRLAIESLKEELGRQPTDDEILLATGFDTKFMNKFEIDEDDEKELELLIKVGVINNNLRKARIEKGFLRQKDFSLALGKSIQWFGGVESCRYFPNKEEQELIANFLGKSIDSLFPKWLEIFTYKWSRQERQKLVKLSTVQLESKEMLMLPSGDDTDPIRLGEKAIAEKIVREAIKKANLSPREKKILDLRFGLDGSGSRDLEETGREFDITRERVRQIEAKALEKLIPFINYE